MAPWLMAVAVSALVAADIEPLQGEPWLRHTICSVSDGADGARMADADGDGDLDIATGWEEGGIITVVLNPGPAAANQPWPYVIVGNVASPEDAVLVDLDSDGAVDVVSRCEGATKRMYVHWAPGKKDYQNPAAWSTVALPASDGVMRWMFCLPGDVDGRNGIDLLAGGKNDGAAIGWFEAPPNPRNVAEWKWHSIRPAGWIMTLQQTDLNGDGTQDILFSDRRGPTQGVFGLLKQPAAMGITWQEHPIGAQKQEVMFIDIAGGTQIAAPIYNNNLLILDRSSRDAAWTSSAVPFPGGIGKGAAFADINGDGTRDVVLSREQAEDVPGVTWLEAVGKGWTHHRISDDEGIKFDLVVCEDLDGDGDVDVVTCEERANLGIIWYENPTRQRGE